MNSTFALFPEPGLTCVGWVFGWQVIARWCQCPCWRFTAEEESLTHHRLLHQPGPPHPHKPGRGLVISNSLPETLISYGGGFGSISCVSPATCWDSHFKHPHHLKGLVSLGEVRPALDTLVWVSQSAAGASGGPRENQTPSPGSFLI